VEKRGKVKKKRETKKKKIGKKVGKEGESKILIWLVKKTKL
jgi:hypothetical protein